MPGEVRIRVDVDATGHYRFRVRCGRREITTSVNADLAASFYEDLRLLRWKSAGIHDQGDILLNHVGDRLTTLIAPPATWERLALPDGARHVRVQFSQAAHWLMPFPWELLRVNDQFLIGARGSHLVRQVPAPAPRFRRRDPVINAVHISLGTDSALRFDEERCTLLETVPASIPIEFLIDPSVGHIKAVMDSFRPRIVIVSGHGHYDDLRSEHYLSAGYNGYLSTARLVALCVSSGCQLLVLSTCESARLGGPAIKDGTILPADLIAFSFPVRTTTATQSLACLLQEIVRGQTIDDAMAAVRAIDTEDECAFFNTVHLHRGRARPLHINNAAPLPPAPPATRCPGMELALGTLNSYAHLEEPVTLLAPVGSGGEALIQHWAEFIQRSQSQATRWRVLLGGAPILDTGGAQLVRLAFPYSFVPVPTESLVYCDGMDLQLANTLLAARDQDLAREVAKHPLLGMQGFVNDLITGHTERQAVEHFEQENRMAERAGRLSREGTLFASWLFATKGAAVTTLENRVAFAEKMKDFGIAAPVIVQGMENAVAATVVLARPEGLFLAPEFMLLGERWFPNWRTDHRAAFQRLCAAFFTLAAHDTIKVELGSRVLDWAFRLEDWTTAKYTLVLANPPFAGSLDYESCAKDLQQVVTTKKTELLFLALFLRLLKPGGRAAVIVPDGVLFGSSNAHKKLRKTLVEKQKLDAVVSLPSGVFKPYAGVSTAVLLFTKTNSGGTDYVWFYDIEADGWAAAVYRKVLISTSNAQETELMAKRRGNPNWGKPDMNVPVTPTISEFEQVARGFNLQPHEYIGSTELREWAGRNRNSKFIPELLLEAWGFEVEATL